MISGLLSPFASHTKEICLQKNIKLPLPFGVHAGAVAVKG